ncbi:MAG: YegS/Rv2252/BmrU family lipid kinase [Clostridia bacterium]|nr:YegS/Rv2252/BmrU family lipid kinase [Clostridia bacterium]
MKHIFIINPAAGKDNSFENIKKILELKKVEVDYELYETQAPGDATAYIRKYCREHQNERVRFYACGGDGTLNEVVNGVVGFEHASMGCYPCGSGNDFVKYYGGKKVFWNLEELLDAPEEYIDLMRVGNKYAINATHFGFDSAVAETMMKVRRKKLIGGKNAYTTGVVVGLFKAMKNVCRVSVDGELLNPDGNILLCTIANGQYVGGSFRCAPRSIDNDGELEVCLVKPISVLTFVSLIKVYTEGTHLDDDRFDKILEYRRGKKIEVEAPEGFIYTFDGELIRQNKFTVEVVPNAIRFAVPKSAVYLPGEAHVPNYAEEKETANAL